MTVPMVEVPPLESERSHEELSLDEIEARLCAAAHRHHLEERNIAYWLLEIDEHGWHKERGFSSIGDYAMELAGIKPRKAQYLVFIARRLGKLPKIREAFDTGDLPWTKAREIASVATPPTEAAWLAKALALKNRDLEREVRRHAGKGSGGFVTVTISMPAEVLEMWNDAYELAERISGTELEKWQVLEPTLAEFLGTHLPAAHEGSFEIDGEDELPPEVRDAVFTRDQWHCAFPGCSMRKMLDVHHIVFRSRGGGEELDNKICLCRLHHDLVHRGICTITGRVGVSLKFDRPKLVTEQEPREWPAVDAVDAEAPPAPAEDSGDKEDGDAGDDESWRDEVVADIFDGPPAPRYEPPFNDWNDFMNHWIAQKQARELKDRAGKRRAASKSGAHVCAEEGGVAGGGADPLDGSPSG